MSNSQSVLVEALKFIGLILLIGAASYALLEATPLRGVLAEYTVRASQAVLSLLGQNADIVWKENPHLVGQSFDAELIPLCFGTLELALWSGVVFGTLNRKLKFRFSGFVAGVVLFLVFNPIRIALTLSLFNPEKPFAALVAHDVLFRASLLALFVTAYAVWYTGPEKETTPGAQKC